MQDCAQPNTIEFSNCHRVLLGPSGSVASSCERQRRKESVPPRAEWLEEWYTRLFRDRAVNSQDFAESLGRDAFICGALDYDRRVLAPPCTTAALHASGATKLLPLSVLATLGHMRRKVRERRRCRHGLAILQWKRVMASRRKGRRRRGRNRGGISRKKKNNPTRMPVSYSHSRCVTKVTRLTLSCHLPVLSFSLLSLALPFFSLSLSHSSRIASLSLKTGTSLVSRLELRLMSCVSADLTSSS